jgi:hypothetical protein
MNEQLEALLGQDILLYLEDMDEIAPVNPRRTVSYTTCMEGKLSKRDDTPRWMPVRYMVMSSVGMNYVMFTVPADCQVRVRDRNGKKQVDIERC